MPIPKFGCDCEACKEAIVSTSLQEGAEKFRKKLKKQIVGAIKSTLNAHGRIDRGLIGSVLKRLESQQEYRSLTEQWMKENGESQHS